MNPKDGYIDRFVSTHLREALEDVPVVLIHGARQVGKSTLARHVGAALGYDYVTLDDEDLIEVARLDPSGFVQRLPERVILDEIQRVPEIFRSLKAEVDRKKTPGRFLLTGSANVLLLPRLSESLAGRMATIRLQPLSQAELRNSNHDLLDRLFQGFMKMNVGMVSEPTRQDILSRIVAGGFPTALSLPSHPRRVRWYRDYVSSIVQRDVRDLRNIRNPSGLAKLLELVAGQTARIAKISDLASRLGPSRPTIDSYVSILEQLFLIDQIPAWSANRLKRLEKKPKVHLCDTGLVCALLGLDRTALYHDRETLGQILETFVFQELRKHDSWNDTPTSFFHYRDRDGGEVDIVMERPGRGIVCVEVKSAESVTRRDFRHIDKVRRHVGKRFVAGYVVYTGASMLPFQDDLYALPVEEIMYGSPRQR